MKIKDGDGLEYFWEADKEIRCGEQVTMEQKWDVDQLLASLPT